jgi:hypothetical protein
MLPLPSAVEDSIAAASTETKQPTFISIIITDTCVIIQTSNISAVVLCLDLTTGDGPIVLLSIA